MKQGSRTLCGELQISEKQEQDDATGFQERGKSHLHDEVTTYSYIFTYMIMLKSLWILSEHCDNYCSDDEQSEQENESSQTYCSII